MRYLLLTILCFNFSVYAADKNETFQKTQKYDLVGKKRNFSLFSLGAHMVGRLAHINGRITRSGGDPATKPAIIFNNVYRPIAPKTYNVTIGYPTKGLPVATGSIRTFRVKRKLALIESYSGSKRQLFEKVFAFVNKEENKNRFSGEVRFIVDPYRTNLYDIECDIQYILK